jgi:hemoglobin
MSTIDPPTSRDESTYRVLGEMEGCLKLARAFYARVEHDPVLRPMFPSSFRCAIEGFAMFLAEFLGGPRDYTASRWSISLIDIHRRFKIGPREREHWLSRMSEAIDDMKIAEPGRGALQHVFASVSGYMIGEPQAPLPPKTRSTKISRSVGTRSGPWRTRHPPFAGVMRPAPSRWPKALSASHSFSCSAS